MGRGPGRPMSGVEPGRCRRAAEDSRARPRSPQPNPRHLSGAGLVVQTRRSIRFSGAVAEGARPGRRIAAGLRRQATQRRPGPAPIPPTRVPHRAGDAASGPTRTATAPAERPRGSAAQPDTTGTTATGPDETGPRDTPGHRHLWGPSRGPPDHAAPCRPNRRPPPLCWASPASEASFAPSALPASGAGAEGAHPGELDA